MEMTNFLVMQVMTPSMVEKVTILLMAEVEMMRCQEELAMILT